VNSSKVNVIYSRNSLCFERTDPIIGLTVRKAIAGPERELIERFLLRITNSADKIEKKLAIFQQPSIQGGFPDVVITIYDPARFDNWDYQRSLLTIRDIKILHHMHTVGEITSASLVTQLGFDVRKTSNALEALFRAGLVTEFGGIWKATSLAEMFGIERLIAVEAKTIANQSVVRQAVNNRWFASESYVLVPNLDRNSRLLSKSESLGIGIYTCSETRVERLLDSKPNPLPGSYASWMFNEWIGRSLVQ